MREMMYIHSCAVCIEDPARGKAARKEEEELKRADQGDGGGRGRWEEGGLVVVLKRALKSDEPRNKGGDVF